MKHYRKENPELCEYEKWHSKKNAIIITVVTSHGSGQIRTLSTTTKESSHSKTLHQVIVS